MTDRKRKREQTHRKPEGEEFTIYNRVRLLRQNRGLSQQDLADELGMNYRSVGYLERQDYEPSLRLAWKISDFFGVPLETVFSREEFPPLGEQLSGSVDRRRMEGGACAE